MHFAGGGEFRSRDGAPAFTLVFNRAAAYARIAAFGHIGLLESYFDGDLDIEGDLAAAMAAGLDGGVAGANPLVGVRNRWHELRFSNRDWAQAKKNAEFHYALGT